MAQPSRSSRRQTSSTALCSVWLVTRCRPLRARARMTPNKARLLASVAPEVQTIAPGSMSSRAATCVRAVSTARAAARPKTWVLEEGLPKIPS